MELSGIGTDKMELTPCQAYSTMMQDDLFDLFLKMVKMIKYLFIRVTTSQYH